MPRPPKLVDPDGFNYLTLRLPGWLKNEVVAHCGSLDVSLNGWLVEAVRSSLREQRGVPEPPVARNPIPTPADEIRAWAMGERLLAPCGVSGSCPATEGQTWEHDHMVFCRKCDIRVA